MNNSSFVKEYGKREFYDMCKYICMQLSIAKAQRKIGGFKINNKQKRVKFYRKDKENVSLDFATIYDIGCSKLKQYIDKM